MQNKVFRFGPVAIAAAAANVLNAPTAAGGTNAGAASQYIILKHLRVINKSAAAVPVSLWIGATGATAAGTEFAWSTTLVPANTGSTNFLDWYSPGLRLDAADFLVALAGTVTTLVITGEGEIGVSG